MDTEYGNQALANQTLYTTIVEHRRKFSALKGIDYDTHSGPTINFVPPANSVKAWEKDYGNMQANMIYGDPPFFKQLMARLTQLKERFKTSLPDKSE